MKTKNLMLGIFAFVFALGSAFASLSSAPMEYVEVYTDPSQTATACRQVSSNQCDGGSTQPCKISVSNLTVGTQNTDQVFSNSGCSTRLNHSVDIFLPGVAEDGDYSLVSPI